jgi:TPR repeat protein
MRLSFLAVAVLLLGVCAPALGNPRLDRAAALWEAGNWAAARPLLRRLALEGDPAAETLLGVMAARGLGEPRNPAVAAAWYWRAARRGYGPARLALGDAFRRGEGVPADPARATSVSRGQEQLISGAETIF